jgi:hypothetical protein
MDGSGEGGDDGDCILVDLTTLAVGEGTFATHIYIKTKAI